MSISAVVIFNTTYIFMILKATFFFFRFTLHFYINIPLAYTIYSCIFQEDDELSLEPDIYVTYIYYIIFIWQGMSTHLPIHLNLNILASYSYIYQQDDQLCLFSPVIYGTFMYLYGML